MSPVVRLVLSCLRGLLGGGRCLKPGVPHLYAPERSWPGFCWCSRPAGDPVHQPAAGPPADLVGESRYRAAVAETTAWRELGDSRTTATATAALADPYGPDTIVFGDWMPG